MNGQTLAQLFFLRRKIGMTKEIAQYINTLLADRERLLNEREEGSEDWNTLKQETKSELANIYQAQKAMDYIIEEEEGMQ